MELALIFLLIGAVLGGAGGYMLATHIHSVAAAATSAAARAVTLPAGVVGTIAAVSPMAANALATQTEDLKAHITAAVQNASRGGHAVPSFVGEKREPPNGRSGKSGFRVFGSPRF